MREYIKDYIELTKIGINKSNLFTVFAGFILASKLYSFNLTLLVYTLIGTALIIAGSSVINNCYDVDIDKLMDRTKHRALPQGRVSDIKALMYGILLVVSGLCILLYNVNLEASFLGFVGFFVYVFIYTMWLKRCSIWNTIIGGICGAVPPVIGWVAGGGEFDLTALSLFLILFMWQPPHFYALAMLKADDYGKASIPMLPTVKGLKRTKIEILIFVVFLLPSSLLLVYTKVVGNFYLLLASILGIIYIYLAIIGFKVSDNNAWAKKMFFYSLVYLTIIMLLILIDVAISELKIDYLK